MFNLKELLIIVTLIGAMACTTGDRKPNFTSNSDPAFDGGGLGTPDSAWSARSCIPSENLEHFVQNLDDLLKGSVTFKNQDNFIRPQNLESIYEGAGVLGYLGTIKRTDHEDCRVMVSSNNSSQLQEDLVFTQRRAITDAEIFNEATLIDRFGGSPHSSYFALSLGELDENFQVSIYCKINRSGSDLAIHLAKAIDELFGLCIPMPREVELKNQPNSTSAG